MRGIKLTIAYDGAAYAGWQIQSHQPTVQETLQRALAEVAGQPIHVMASGRTDAGVHALGQVASFRTDCSLSCATLVRALNAHLPDDVAVLAAEEVSESFHATIDTLRKRYRYLIDNGPVRDVFRRRYAWHCPQPLDVEAMQRAARALVGTHDFGSFQSSGSPRQSSVRTVYELDVRRGQGADRSLVVIQIEADGFLYNMVRAIVGSLVFVGRGRRPESWLAEVLTARDRRRAGRTAPPQGLFLVSAAYDPEPGQGRAGERGKGKAEGGTGKAEGSP